MNTIEISVKELYDMAKQLMDDKMDTVELMLSEADGEGANALPACVVFTASSADEPECGVDYGEIEALSQPIT